MPDKRKGVNPVSSMRRDRKIVLSEQDIQFAENLPQAPGTMHMKVDNRANKNKKRYGR